MAESTRSRRRRTRRRRAVAIGVGVLIVAGGGAVAIAATGDNGPSLRLATVRRGSVTQTVEASGTVTSSLKVTPAFAVDGTVASVAVKVGDQVAKGQVLARLDATALQATVDTAQATLASARQRLESDRTGQLSTSANSASANSASANSASANSASANSANTSGGSADRGGTGNLTTSSLSAVELSAPAKPTAPPAPRTGTVGQLSARVKQAQTAVLDAQHAVDQDQVHIDAAQRTVDTAVAQNTTLRNAQQTACAADPSGSTVSPACASAMTAYEASADILSGDLATLDAAITAQDGALAKVAAASTALDRLVTQLRAAAAAAGRSTGSGSSRAPSAPTTGKAPTSGSGRSTTGSGGTSSGTSSSSGKSTATPASASQLAADQAAIDAAAAQLTLARQNLAGATLTSPVAGRVAAVGLSPGTSSSGQTITILGTHGQGVQTSVPLAQIDTVKLGQHVTVAADGVTATLRGTVTSVGLLSTSTGSTTTFPVTVTLAPGSRHLFDGIGADVVIATGTVADVITVPNSAIHSGVRGTHTVSVRTRGRTSTRPITLGLVGTDVTQVTSGLRVGDQVVLAELSQRLPSSSTANQGSTFGRGGAFFVPRFDTGRGGGR